MILLSFRNKRRRRPHPLHPDPPPSGEDEGVSPPWGILKQGPGPAEGPLRLSGGRGKVVSCSQANDSAAVPQIESPGRNVNTGSPRITGSRSRERSGVIKEAEP
ncbi:hypothetical protein PBY51_009194 [Eleginops maclovinus]|uniref:Uncharacterized protein n=1 Tax=Eleginops maclovinus TaxID=56733 RepID=A0AAN7XWJ0_ELEMC|nr:hypothetical protein PBY51_009194 [Eleginops maclovinus]